MIVRKLRAQLLEDIFRDRDIRRGDARAVVFPLALHAAKLAVHEFGLREHGGFTGIDTGKQFSGGG
jgi:hypothetical protein